MQKQLVITGISSLINELTWWGELLVLLKAENLEVLFLNWEQLSSEMVVLDAGGAGIEILRQGAVLIKPPEQLLPLPFVAGRDYLQWEIGKLAELVKEILRDEIRQGKLRKESQGQLKLWLEQNAVNSEVLNTELDLYLKVRRYWNSPAPHDWEIAVELLFESGVKKQKNQAVLGLRKVLVKENDVVAEDLSKLNNLFEQIMKENVVRDPVLRLEWSILLGLLGKWEAKRDLLQDLLAKELHQYIKSNDLTELVLPELLTASSNELIAFAWRELGEAWEKLNYLGLARLCLVESLKLDERAITRGRLGLLIEKGGDPAEALLHLTKACQVGCLDFEVWEHCLELTCAAGEIREARNYAKLGILLYQLKGKSTQSLAEVLERWD